MWSPLFSSHLYFKDTFFLSCRRKFHINWISFKRPLFQCPKVNLLIQVYLWINMSTLVLWWICRLVAVTSWHTYNLLLSSCSVTERDISSGLLPGNKFWIANFWLTLILCHVTCGYIYGNEFRVTWEGWGCYDFFSIFMSPNFILYFAWRMQNINYLYCNFQKEHSPS